MYQKETCSHQLSEVLDKTTMEQCQNLINNIIEARHTNVLNCQMSKFDVLYQQKLGVHSNFNQRGGHSNIGTNTADTRFINDVKTSYMGKEFV